MIQLGPVLANRDAAYAQQLLAPPSPARPSCHQRPDRLATHAQAGWPPTPICKESSVTASGTAPFFFEDSGAAADCAAVFKI